MDKLSSLENRSCMLHLQFPQKLEEYNLQELTEETSITKLYKGQIKDYNEKVLIKIYDFSKFLNESSISEVLLEHFHTSQTMFMRGSKLIVVLEYYEGMESLEQIIKNRFPHGIQNLNILISVLYHILETMDYYHSKNLILREIKSTNIFIGKEGQIQMQGPLPLFYEKVAKEIPEEQPWLSVESIKNSSYNKATDLWSFGITALELSTGKTPKLDIGSSTLMYHSLPLIFDPKSHLYCKELKEIIDLTLKRKNFSVKEILKHPLFKSHVKSSSCLKKLWETIPISMNIDGERLPWYFEIHRDKSPFDSCQSDSETNSGDESDHKKEVLRSNSLQSKINSFTDIKQKGRFKIESIPSFEDIIKPIGSPLSLSDNDSPYEGAFIKEEKGRFSVITQINKEPTKSTPTTKDKMENQNKSNALSINTKLPQTPQFESIAKSPSETKMIKIGRFQVKESNEAFPDTPDEKKGNSKSFTFINEDRKNDQKKEEQKKEEQKKEEQKKEEQKKEEQKKEEQKKILFEPNETTKGRFKISSLNPHQLNEKYILKTSLGKEFIIDTQEGQEIVKNFLDGENETREGTFAIEKGSFVINGTGTPVNLIPNTEITTKLDEPFEGNFTAKKSSELNSTELVNGKFSITSPRYEEKKVGRFTIQTLSSPHIEEGHKKKKSLEKRKKLISLKQGHEVNLITLQSQINILKDQNERQLSLLEKLVEKETKREEMINSFCLEMKKMQEEILKLKQENQLLKGNK